ncbi:DNA alkylation repair protein, partial [bacterium]|nr:DNA alkylation repair protein [bacterium]
MAERLKELFFTRDSINTFAYTIKKAYSDFDKKRFIDLVFDTTFESKELKERMTHTTRCLHETLSKSYTDALMILKKAAPFVKGFEALTLPDYVAEYGM